MNRILVNMAVIGCICGGCGESIDIPFGPDMKYAWSKSSIPVPCFHDVGEYWVDLYNDAADEINSIVEFDVLESCQQWTKITDFPNRLLGFILFDVRDVGPVGRTRRFYTITGNEMMAAYVVMHPEIEQLTYKVMVHELGHALGLEHDKDPNSMMYPIITDDTFFQQNDIDLLREVYGE